MTDWETKFAEKNKEIINESPTFSESEKCIVVIEDELNKHQCVEFKDLDKETLSEMLETIYRLCHGVNKYHTCYDVHSSWREEMENKFENILNKIKNETIND